MTPEQVVRDFFESVLAGPVAAESVLERLDPAFVDHDAAGDDAGPDGVVDKLAGLWSALPDGRYRILRLVADGDLVAVHSLLEAPGVAVPFADFYRVSGNRVAEHWHVVDSAELGRALGGA